jgi:succinate dehydrogenase / fumarate reductase flavoprotein subunit
MEFLQFHPTGMVSPPSVKGILVTESVRGDGGVLKNSDGKRFMFDYVPDVFRKQYAETEEEADRWYTDPDNNRRPPELLPRDEVARAINTEVKAGRGTESGGVYLDIASRRPAEFILKRLPSMYHQFKELADVDITKTPMEIGPTCHYVMGGVEVDPDTAAAAGRVQGLFAAGEVSGGMHGSNRLGGNSLSDLLVFGKRAGDGAADYLDSLGSARPTVSSADLDAAVAEAVPTVSPEAIDAAATTALAPLERGSKGENPYQVWHDLQEVMQSLVGIIRRKGELEESIKLLGDLRTRVDNVGATGGRKFNPGWHLALDLRNMLIVSECTARAALEREESRGGHTREDFPQMDSKWRQVNLICSLNPTGDGIELTHKSLPTLRPELLGLFDESELSKYMTKEELTDYEAAAAAAKQVTVNDTVDTKIGG